jgi:hypothetical protein
LHIKIHGIGSGKGIAVERDRLTAGFTISEIPIITDDGFCGIAL